MIKKLNSSPKREPLSRLWFMARGYSQAPLDYMNGKVTYVHPQTNTALNQYGQSLTLELVPQTRFKKKTVRYYRFCRERKHRLLAHVKYLTFVGDIPEGCVIDHIDGNTLNNNPRNLRAVPPAINSRDGGFLRKLRNNNIDVKKFPGMILEGFERMAEWKATHTQWQYKKLTGEKLLRVFVGPTFKIVDPLILNDLELTKHYDPFVERS